MCRPFEMKVKLVVPSVKQRETKKKAQDKRDEVNNSEEPRRRIFSSRIVAHRFIYLFIFFSLSFGHKYSVYSNVWSIFCVHHLSLAEMNKRTCCTRKLAFRKLKTNERNRKEIWLSQTNVAMQCTMRKVNERREFDDGRHNFKNLY